MSRVGNVTPVGGTFISLSLPAAVGSSRNYALS
jgi:hypothetical protein